MIIENVILGENTEEYLDKKMVNPEPHIIATERPTEEYKVELDDNGELVWDMEDKKPSSNTRFECKTTGKEFNSEEEVKQYLENYVQSAHNTREEIEEALEGVKMYGFEFSGIDYQSSSIIFRHRELALKLYASPLEVLTGERNVLGIQLDGNKLFENVRGNQEKVEFIEGLTFREYLGIVRNYIERELLHIQKWESKPTNEDSRWKHSETGMEIRIRETNENEDYVGNYLLYSLAGNSECPFETSDDHTELVEKAITYKQGNPKGRSTVGYQEVIKNSEKTFTGLYHR